MKSMPNYETKISYVEEGGYDETKWVPCNNCSYWTEKQKANNPCTVCRNQGGKTIKTGKYIPKTKRKVENKINIGWNGTNESGFSGLPGGYRDFFGSFDSIGGYAKWWSASECLSGGAYYRHLYYGNDFLPRHSTDLTEGFSVRCLKD